MNELERFKLPEDCMAHEWALQAADDVAKYTIKTIKAAPTVDAVPVIRCKDCKWWGLPEGMYATENVKHCELGRYMVAAEGYCVYGEVKSNAAD